jgi:hypothetical protein
MKKVLISFILFMNACTGINVANRYVSNMNPVPENADIISLFLKGGLFYHSESNIIFNGNANLKRSGRSCSHSFAYLIGIGDSSIDSAKVEGAISQIGMIEQETVAILGAGYHRHCTILRGE